MKFGKSYWKTLKEGIERELRELDVTNSISSYCGTLYYEFIRKEIFHKLKEIIHAYKNGTLFSICIDKDEPL
jgi:hypothetical protein